MLSAALAICAHDEVFLDRHAAERATTLWDVRNAEISALIFFDRQQILALEAHAAARHRLQAGNDTQQRRLARAV